MILFAGVPTNNGYLAVAVIPTVAVISAAVGITAVAAFTSVPRDIAFKSLLLNIVLD
jgi:hypothetical protein